MGPIGRVRVGGGLVMIWPLISPRHAHEESHSTLNQVVIRISCDDGTQFSPHSVPIQFVFSSQSVSELGEPPANLLPLHCTRFCNGPHHLFICIIRDLFIIDTHSPSFTYRSWLRR
jgi:hypothetical protein